MSLHIQRFGYTPHGTFGKLMFDELECFTVERPWLNNEPRQSCIPEGAYTIKLGTYNRGGYPAYEILNVPNRSLIKIHKGNSMDDVIGCVALGKSLGYIHGKWAVAESGIAFFEFMEAMQSNPTAQLVISQYKPSGNWS